MEINRTKKLYVLPSGAGYSCLGFDVAERKRRAVLAWMGKPSEPMRTGTKKHWSAYHDTMMEGFAYAEATGKRCDAELTPALVGLERRRVEVVTPTGERSRFIVGKSTGWMPCHLEIKRRDSIGGCAAYVPPGSTVRLVA